MYSIEHKNVVISISTADKRRNHIIEQFGQKQIPFEFFDAFTPSDRLDAHLQPIEAEYYSSGSTEEAEIYAKENFNAWFTNGGAIDWLLQLQ